MLSNSALLTDKFKAVWFSEKANSGTGLSNQGKDLLSEVIRTHRQGAFTESLDYLEVVLKSRKCGHLIENKLTKINYQREIIYFTVK